MIKPVIENSYLVSSKLSREEIDVLFAGLRANNPQCFYDFSSLPLLVNLLAKQGFSEDDSTGESLAMRNYGNGIDVYLSPKGRFTLLKISKPHKKFGIYPDYLDGLIRQLEVGSLRIKEIPGAKRIYHNNPAPYDWGTEHGRLHLAGAPR